MFRTFVLMIIFSAVSFSQSARELYSDAVRLMSDGKFESAIDKLDSAFQIEPDANYAYEIAHCHYQLHNYRDAIFILDTLIRRDDAPVHYFQMLGNAYDYITKKDAAENIYTYGLTRYPNSARLYTELGTLKASLGKDNEAQQFWETATEKDPYYDEVYYRLAVYFYAKKHYAATIFYGELFLNTTFNESKFRDISKMIYESFNNSLCLNCDNTLNMISNNEIFIFDEKFSFTKLYNFAYKKVFNEYRDSLSINDIYLLRQRFMKENAILAEQYPINSPLIPYLKLLESDNYFEEYHYWLLSEGNTTELIAWAKQNYERFKEFVEWKTENRITLKK